MSSRLVRAVIDAHALQHNLAVVRRFAPHSKIMAVVKANAYGHGLVPTVLALADADAFAVARLEEGIALRNAGVHGPVILLEGVFTAPQLAEAAHENFELMVHSPEQIALLAQWRGAHRFTVWLKLDSGMNRLGFRPEEFNGAYESLYRESAVARIRLLTHLANADDLDDPMTGEQLAVFERTTAKVIAAAGKDGTAVECSIANSAGVLGWRETHAQWVRPGLMLYGACALKDGLAAQHDLRPAMTLFSTVIAVKKVLTGETVGYGGRWTARRPTTLAIVAVGYGDGYPRHMVDGAPLLVNGRQAAMVGRVSMDMIGVDVTDLPPVTSGDTVVLWGEGLPVETVAPYAATIPYELLCGVSQRVAVELK